MATTIQDQYILPNSLNSCFYFIPHIKKLYITVYGLDRKESLCNLRNMRVAPEPNHQVLLGTSIKFDSKHTDTKYVPLFSNQSFHFEQSFLRWPLLLHMKHFICLLILSSFFYRALSLFLLRTASLFKGRLVQCSIIFFNLPSSWINMTFIS